MATIVDSYSETNYSSERNINGDPVIGMGQSFTGDGGVLNSAKFYVCKYGSPTGNVYAKIYAHTGTFGVNGKPTGSPLATSDARDISTFVTYFNIQLETFTFSGADKITLGNGTKYVVTIEYDNGDTSNFLKSAYDSSSPTHPGNESYETSGGWTAVDPAYEHIFYVYKDDVGPTGVKTINDTAIASVKTINDTATNLAKTINDAS